MVTDTNPLYEKMDDNLNADVRDRLGSTVAVTDKNGTLMQQNGYYPYGEPWREPSGQPYLYGGKERMRDNGLNEYDFSARRLNSALCLWTTPDPLAQKFVNTNPYTYCAAMKIWTSRSYF